MTVPASSILNDMGMSAAEFKVVRENLGVSAAWMADYLDVSIRTINHWESGAYPLPPGAVREVLELEDFTDTLVGEMVAQAKESGTLSVYQADNRTGISFPGRLFLEMPSAWQRRAAARARAIVPEVEIDYLPETTRKQGA